MLMDSRLARDRATPASQAFLVLAVELDTGLIILADAPRSCGLDVCLPAVLTWSSVSAEGAALDVEAQALPAETDDAWWINREAMILECTPDMGSIYDGRVVFDGIIAAQPDSAAGVLSLRIGPARRRVRQVPDYGLITATDWPLAADAAMGQAKPLIVGTVDGCPLLAVQVQPWTTLTEAAAPGDAQLAVADGALLAASGSVVVDGHTYTYTSRSDGLLLGMSIAGAHRPGTLVAQAGSSVYLAAGHAVTAIETLRADSAVIEGGTVSLAAATVTYTAPPAVVASAERSTRFVQFDDLATGNTATNGVNAIRAIINTYSQSGTPSGGVLATTENGGITFARPVDGNRIVSGTYAVGFSVAVGSQVGWARVKVGGDVVWFYEPASGVVYNATPAAITFDDDADFLPVVVEVETGGSADQVTVTVASASRTILTGHLDDASYATVAPGQTLKVKQATVNADLGPIASVKLGVRWFKTDATAGSTGVTFDGRALGALNVTQSGGASLNQTISVDVTSQGNASLPQQNINTVVSGGTASLSHQSIVQQASITVPMLKDIGAGVYRGYSPMPSFDGWDASLGAIVFKFMITGTTPTDAENKYSSGAFAEYLNAAGSPVTSGITAGATETVVAGQLYAIVRQLTFTPASLRFVSIGYTGLTYPMQSVAVSWNGKITQGAATVSSVAASGASDPISAQNLSHAGTAVAVSNGNVTLTVPAPPRMVDTLFDLAGIREWDALTDTVAEISLTGGSASLAICQIWLQVEFDVQTFAAAEQIIATVTGLSGNPADVIELLAGYSGQSTDSAAVARLSAWANTNSIAYARRLSQPADALTLLQFALDQVNAIAVYRDGRIAPIRRLDLASDITRINEAELLAPAGITWAERMDNAITVRYAEDYATGAGFTRVVQATSANNLYCRRSLAAINETRAVDIEAGFIRSDATASRMLTDLARWAALPRRVLSLPCTYSQTAAEGDLIEYLALGADPGDGILARITGITTDSGWPTPTAEEIPAP